METASRLQKLTPSLTLAIDSKAKALKAEGVDVINFGAGEPDFDTPDHIKAAAMGSLDAGFTKYTPSSGIPELRAAIAEKLKADNGLDYKPSQIIVNNGAKHSCFNAILAAIEPEDEVIIPAPYWLSYPEMVKIAGGVPIIVPTKAENGYKITPEEFEAAMSPKTRMIIINSPGNPTGSIYTKEELEALAEIAVSEEILILSDEIYEKLIFDGQKHFSIATISKEVYNLTFTVNGFSKPYAMTGWRLGYVAAPEWAAKAIDSLQSQTTSNPCSFAQKGALAAYKGPQDCVTQMVAEYDARRALVIGLVEKIEKLTYVRPQGAFYILLNVAKTGLTSTQFAEKLLDKQNVAVVPGIAFGDDEVVRLSYATSRENIEKGLKRIGEFVAGL
ncbi:aspartate aminotransferase [Verrucomicrobium sp. GAS474]|uniref:pyridoxal phosphate-dependent aminotransferase n=1 Tax=Verrucomicrobium sp. GAS474 TaxID=1882831 RepID=UPI00087D6451|nr:pyridoxal phosphate-dependent aminotransferase [Verrucomicrobium sp. GAS474]SDU09145.1 aspartate aminotransferase [Verrucomicrobium sp. GAS474]